jgi:hypothetical protein
LHSGCNDEYNSPVRKGLLDNCWVK